MANIPLWVWDKPTSGRTITSPLFSEDVRNNLNALGTLNWTTDPNYPLNPRNGMPRTLANDLTNIRLQVYRNGTWITVIEHLESLLVLARRVEVAITVAAAVWTIDHLMTRRPVVQCVDAAGQVVTPTSIQHVQIAGVWNRVVVTHGAPMIGTAILIG